MGFICFIGFSLFTSDRLIDGALTDQAFIWMVFVSTNGANAHSQSGDGITWTSTSIQTRPD